MENKICPNCKSNVVVKRGFFFTTNGKQQRYFCKNCNKKFIEQTPFYRMRNSPQKITLCLDLFFRGISTRKIQEHLRAFYPHNADNSNIYRWIVKYSNQISKFTDNLKLSVGKEIQIDEIQFNRRKFSNKRGIETNWFFDGIDTKTRFMVSSEYSKARSLETYRGLVKRAKEKTGTQIEICTTDGATLYDETPKVWGYSIKSKKYQVVHNRVNASQGEGFNILIERLHNNIRQRTKTFRGFHGSLESANAKVGKFITTSSQNIRP